MTKKPLVILTGPTAVGKTALSIKLAKAINGEIISADSMQVYRRMDIGTAKITSEEMDGVPHHLIDVLEPSEDFNVFLFKEMAQRCINEIYGRGHVPIIAGGTGFYIQALLYDVDFEESDADEAYREEIRRIALEKGNGYVHDMLEQVDPEAAARIHFNNLKRMTRALEYYRLTGKKISGHNEEQKTNESPYDFAYFVLTDDRERLYNRIDLRVDKMVEEGLVDEVKSLVAEGLGENNISMKAIGYREILEYLDGKVELSKAIDNIKLDTRHFAKRQMTWFRRERTVTMIDKNDFADEDAILEYMINYLGAIL